MLVMCTRNGKGAGNDCHEYDSHWIDRHTNWQRENYYHYPNTLEWFYDQSCFGKWTTCVLPAPPEIIPVLEAWERAIDNWDIEGL